MTRILAIPKNIINHAPTTAISGRCRVGKVAFHKWERSTKKWYVIRNPFKSKMRAASAQGLTTAHPSERVYNLLRSLCPA